MGEIFAVEAPATGMEFTGERMTSGAHGQIEYEHIHRYCFARLLCRGKDVVDVAAGEGYGSALLAQVARSVIGVELATDAIAHAVSAYRRPNLRFVQGDARHLPLRSDSADVVVSFETLEHLYEQELFLAEIRRVLRPDGLLVISSPNSEIYSTIENEVNPFHVRELTCEEFKETLRTVFPHVHLYSQRALIGSAMTLDAQDQGLVTFERRSDDYIDASKGLPRAPYLVAVASHHRLDAPQSTLYIDLTSTARLLMSRISAATGEMTADERLQALVEETAALKTALGERDAEIDRQRVTISEATRQRDAAKLAAAEAAHYEVDRLRAAMGVARRQLAERTRAEATLRAKVNQLEKKAQGQEHEASVNFARQLAEYARATAETEAALHAKVSRLSADAKALHRPGSGLARQITGRLLERRQNAAIQAGAQAFRSRNWPAAVRHYERALTWAPDLMPIWVQLGHARKETGDAARAEAAYRRALALDASVADTHLQLGHLMKLSARWDEAADAYSRALHLDPQLSDAARELDELCGSLIEQADNARDARNWPLAARFYKLVLERQPGLMPLWVQLGHALKEHGEFDQAEDAYRRALALDPASADLIVQLGHLFSLQGRRAQAIEAYSTALRLDPEMVAAREALNALHDSPSEMDRTVDLLSADLAASSHRPLTLAERYGALFGDASRKTGAGHDVIWLGVIDWHFRIQRPQHLASHLADAGSRILYVSLVFEPADERGRFRIVEALHPGVFGIRLRLTGDPTESIYRGLSESAIGEMQSALDELIAVLGVDAPIILVEHPGWHHVACGVPGATVVYDCLDLASGFSYAAKSMAALEAAVVADADLVIAASRPLAEHFSPQRSSILIRNAAEADFFAQGYADRVAGKHPVIGYFGAIADWFNIEWIEHCAVARPDWDFRLIGLTDYCDTSRAKEIPNVHFYGEKPYRELPLLLHDFDVAIIPFKLVELIKCTNPVKLYEYMAAGKPVVAAPIPEVIEATDLVYIADDANSFVDRIEQALVEDSPALRAKRQAWAREHTWESRASQLAQALDASFPLVSVVILAYNNWQYTKDCLFSVLSLSDYPNLEVIVVDNASTDGTREKLRELERQDRRLQAILNDTNLGCPGGYNVGLRAARGDYVVLLNNDTFVTRGWVRDLIRPMQLDPRVGLVGPLTNDIGNEQKVKIAYGNMQEMQRAARRFVRNRLRRTLEIGNLAFFCVAMRRNVLEEVGLLDEVYGIGYFEDDDYCRRVSQANYKLVIADDVFVHHQHSASFDMLGAKAGEQMARNRAIFEQRWGPWQPHRYRREVGFG